MSVYEVKIEQFEGPLDLLLYLVQKNELNPIEISISEICDQFIEYIRDVEKTDLSKAGDFLYMAAHLMSLKARELLPKEDQGDKEMMEFDEEREELIRRMLEYKQYKDVSEEFRDLEDQNFGTYSRGRTESSRDSDKKQGDLDVGVFELYSAFLNTIKIDSAENFHTIEVDYVTIEDRQQAIENVLEIEGRATFEELLGRDFQPIMISVTFMALLEMVKLDKISIREASMDSVIRIYRRKNNLEYLDEMYLYIFSSP